MTMDGSVRGAVKVNVSSTGFIKANLVITAHRLDEGKHCWNN